MSAHERFDRGDVVPQSGLSCRGAKLTRHLSVTLAKNDLSLTISFEESEEEEPEDTEVEVVILQTGDKGDLQLLRTTFRFGDISLKPISELGDGEQPAITSGQSGDEGPELA